MKRFLFSLLASFVCSSAFAADGAIGQSERRLHRQMLEYFQSKEKEKGVPPSSGTAPAPYSSTKSIWDREYFTGDWGGARNTLADAGITIGSSYVADFGGNPVGGKAQGFAYAGSYGVSINFDFTKAGWTGFNLFSSAVWRTGTNLSTRKIDNQFTIAQVYGSQIVRLNELYVLQNLFDERLAIKAGRLDAGNDFLSSPLYWHYMNNAFDGNPVGIFFNIPFTAYPKATWGAYLFAKPLEWLTTKFAVYNANTNIQKNRYHGMNFTFSSTNGVVWITEWCGLVNQGKTSHGMPGNYKVGFFYLTGHKDKFSGGIEHGDPGVYFLFDQMIYRKGGAGSKRGLTPFISVLVQPKNRNLFPLFIDGGLVYQGPFAGRPNDSAAVGFAYGSYSSSLNSVQRKTGKKVQTAETVLELNYWFQLNNWFYIMPDLQYIIRPKGLSTPNALVLGAQIGLVNL